MTDIIATKNPEVGETIWHQISIQTKMSVGARKAVIIDNGLRFTVLNGRTKQVVIRLNHWDYYDVQFVHVSKWGDEKILDERGDVPEDVLNETIYNLTHK